MNLIDQIKLPIQAELNEFADLFYQVLDTDNELLLAVMHFIQSQKGKQLRPVLTILAAKLCGQPNIHTLESAKALELLHTASLVHDDIVDYTFERRGLPSVNAKWDNAVAVYMGDFLFSKALQCAISTSSLAVLGSISNIGIELTKGELLQLQNNRLSEMTEERYSQIIKMKTAQLFSSCCEIGAITVGASDETVQRLRDFGMYLGMCFQLKDDLFDYFDDISIGKPTNNDLRDGKITLPLIYALRMCGDEKRNELASMIDNRLFSDENVRMITDFAKESGGLDYAISQMNHYKKKAIEELNGFEDTAVKQSLILCVEYSVSRTY